jgi:hypothetical protein
MEPTSQEVLEVAQWLQRTCNQELHTDVVAWSELPVRDRKVYRRIAIRLLGNPPRAMTDYLARRGREA